ncbi:MAG: hypothetical protein E3K32_12015 [wastewater metagenome]|nr:hypothetical protein [Candidatus Loosdrechtia aerotolerans]
MAILAGIDEAGYGPVLGPLVISAVAFDIPDEKADCSLWRLLKDAVSDTLKGKKHRLAIADSKKLYSARTGLKPLEEVVFSVLLSRDVKIASFCQLLDVLSCYHTKILDCYPWYTEKDYQLPLTASVSSVLPYANLLKYVLYEQGVQIPSIGCRVVTVKEWNEQVELSGNKSTVLFDNCISLITGIWNSYDGDIRLVVDKHGGRNSYFYLLKDRLPGADISVLKEGAEVSVYRISEVEKEMQISFVKKGENACMTVALASIFSKYIRELFMRLENQYWIQFMPGLKPTAGYYEDAQRFLSEIDSIRKREAIQDTILIRNK